MTEQPDFHVMVRADLLVMAHRFVSADSLRVYLQGVWIEPSAEGGAVLVATDGWTMAVFHDPDAMVNRPVNICLPPAARIAGARSKTSTRRHAKPTFPFFALPANEPVPGRALGWITGAASVAEAAELADMRDANWCGVVRTMNSFTEWRVCVPRERKPSAHPGAFNPELLSRFAPIGKPMSIYLGQEHEPALIECGRTDFFGLIMPMKADRALFSDMKASAPAWMNAPAKAERQAA
ncbi:conserved protein of unknown function (plasmid) [Rhodovastum atsumiense]|uniref:DNA polymerase III beta sliding clamp central domain-containing protein n=1 Tax=Rhodovastum atsumiense TaxID=504468 RepID=A0A5M6IMY7_9PROT|nr:hypothetical protein [Rhodovastum atsumiense]KAA5609620.1 hypothetical protein F1189_22930 [Rhodovastum atsumiense]CAH2606481.1 conserved protein of unknown function [Rhodovastum atsumiense]